ncbi:MAG: hypothetical protein GY696_31845, partial [Gammaproteobacteria bacterium]|nr:hypothetical protein [Gammaproteobacteria bacterium]
KSAITIIRRRIVLATQKTNFHFDGQNFDQVDGLAMGSPLSPILANIFMSKWESQALASAPVGPITWIRYVDDTFVRFAGNDQLPVGEFFEFINSIHPSIKFTMDAEKEGALPFLDVQITSGGDGYKTSVYRKPTNTDLYIRWGSAHPPSVKIGNPENTPLSCAVCMQRPDFVDGRKRAPQDYILEKWLPQAPCGESYLQLFPRCSSRSSSRFPTSPVRDSLCPWSFG